MILHVGHCAILVLSVAFIIYHLEDKSENVIMDSKKEQHSLKMVNIEALYTMR